MNCIVRRLLPAFLLGVSLLALVEPASGQENMSVAARPAVTVLDSTKEQDGLVGSVRRVKTETAKIEFKDGRAVEGPTQLVEVTTYGIKGNRIENTSYPTGGFVGGKEEYKYDEHGNITEMTVRDERGAILSREAYTYEFDKFGNWTKMVTSLVVFENGRLKQEPVEITYRTVTYYYDDNIAKIVEEPKAPVRAERVLTAPAVPEAANAEVRDQPALQVDLGNSHSSADSTEMSGEPPPLLKRAKTEPEGTESVFTARKGQEPATDAARKTNEPTEDVSAEPFAVSVKEAPKPEVKTAPPAASSAPTIQKQAFDLYMSGRNRFDTGDAPGAVDLYLQSIKLEPGSSEVHLNLGHAYLKLQKDREAVKAFKESVKLNPNLAESYYGLGFSNFRLGRYRDAADAFKKATVLAPRMAKAHFGLSLSYQELGMTSAVIEEYRILETLDKSLAKKLAQTFPEFNFSCRLVRGCP
jgi:tetratricopeptide (TPR) repeat protein